MEAVGAAASVAGLLSLAGQCISGAQNLKNFYDGIASASQTVAAFLQDINSLLAALHDVRTLLTKLEQLPAAQLDAARLASLRLHLEDCDKDVRGWVQTAQALRSPTDKGAKAWFRKFWTAVNKDQVQSAHGRIQRRRSEIVLALATLGRFMDFNNVLKVDAVHQEVQSSAQLSHAILQSSQANQQALERIEVLSQAISDMSIGSMRSLASVWGGSRGSYSSAASRFSAPWGPSTNTNPDLGTRNAQASKPSGAIHTQSRPALWNDDDIDKNARWDSKDWKFVCSYCQMPTRFCTEEELVRHNDIFHLGKTAIIKFDAGVHGNAVGECATSTYDSPHPDLPDGTGNARCTSPPHVSLPFKKCPPARPLDELHESSAFGGVLREPTLKRGRVDEADEDRCAPAVQAGNAPLMDFSSDRLFNTAFHKRRRRSAGDAGKLPMFDRDPDSSIPTHILHFTRPPFALPQSLLLGSWNATLLGEWTDTRDRINRWLLHSLASNESHTATHMKFLQQEQEKQPADQACISATNDWGRMVLKYWFLDEAAIGHDWASLVPSKGSGISLRALSLFSASAAEAQDQATLFRKERSTADHVLEAGTEGKSEGSTFKLLVSGLSFRHGTGFSQVLEEAPDVSSA